jgi:hypothetical protein
MTDMSLCPRCSTRLEWASRYGGLEVFRCPSCGFERESTIGIAAPADRYGRDRPGAARVVVRWRSSEATSAEIAALRTLWHRAAAQSDARIRERFGTMEVVELGEFTHAEARELRARGRELGLEIESLDVRTNEPVA